MATGINMYPKKVTPAEAALFLERNKGNRKISQKHVAFLLSEMKNGNWVTTGDALHFDKDGNMMNGQHRCTAIIQYGKPIELFIAENVPREAFKVLDTGKMRSAGDALSIMGVKNCYNVAGITRHILLMRAGRFDVNSGGKKGCSNSDVLTFAQANEKQLQQIISDLNPMYRLFKYAPPSTLGALYYLFNKKDSEKCFQFFEKYFHGIDLGAQNPIRFLREKLITNKSNKSKYNHRDMIALHIFAWNAFREGKKVTSLTLAKKYDFPKIK